MRSTRTACCLAVILAAFNAGRANANDSSAELSTGGLVLTKNPAIELRSEDLFVSPKEIRVHYLFHNRVDAPVTTLVAFPLPDVTIRGSDDVVEVPARKAPENFLSFSTEVNGRPVVAQLEQKVFAKGVDRTDVLRRLDVPLAPYLEGLSERLDALPAAARRELLDLGLVQEEVEYVDTKPVVHLHAGWTLKTSYYWQQTFPPGDTEVTHRYRPSVGISLGTSIGSDRLAEELRSDHPDEMEQREIEDYRSYVRTYCIDSGFLAGARRMNGSLPEQGTLGEQRVSYILTTGANWAGPIKRFRLVVDKEYADNIVSFCGKDVRQTGPTTFEMIASDFVPSVDLSILFLTTHLGE